MSDTIRQVSIKDIGRLSSRRKSWAAVLALLVTFLVLGKMAWIPPRKAFVILSEGERRLEGRWYRPSTGGGGYQMSGRFVTNAFIVHEFKGDRVYRFWAIAADGSGKSLLIEEGRWRIVDGKIRLEHLRNVFRSWSARVRATANGGTATWSQDLNFRFVDDQSFETSEVPGKWDGWEKGRR